MARLIEIPAEFTLADHAAVASLAQPVLQLQREADQIAPRLEGVTVWMISSTERGGGVAEMLPAKITLLRDLGIAVEWIVIETDDPDFFPLTKRLHNLIHDAGEPTLSEQDVRMYEAVNRANAAEILEWVKDDDIVIVHDPQPMPIASLLKEQRSVRTVWRCHIGLDEETERTRAAWRFLEPYSDAYDMAVFSAPEYIPEFFASRAHIIHPAIDPLTPKNEHLGLHHTVQVLSCAGLIEPPGPLPVDIWEAQAKRLQADGSWKEATSPESIGVLTRPIVTQVSRWDRLKGFLPLLHGFVELKRRVTEDEELCGERNRRRVELVRLVLAGPDPESIADDPEGKEVLAELSDEFVSLDPAIRRDVAIVTLPMDSARENALMVNALHRVSTVVAQNSLREGFGLTITEAMWKRIPILTNSRACGPRHQVRDRIDGRVIRDPEDAAAIAVALIDLLCNESSLASLARNAQYHVYEKFLIFTQLRHWIERLRELTGNGPIDRRRGERRSNG